MMRAASQIGNWIEGLNREDRVVTCPIVRGELLFGIARLPEGRRRAELENLAYRLLAALVCESLPEQAGDFYAAVKLSRQRNGLAMDENDLWIAATATALGATLVSRDKAFAGIEGLSIMIPT